MNFIYKDDYSKYRDMLEVRAVDCLCKHVCMLSSEKAKKVYDLSNSVGYDKVAWGHGESYRVAT